MVQQYRPLDLTERLQSFRSQQFTGLICFQSDQSVSNADTSKYFLSFLHGEINYGGTVAPDLDAIAELLTEALEHPFFKMGFRIAREQSKGSESSRAVLSKVVSTRIATWEKIETAMQSQAESTLRLIAQGHGTMTSEPNAGIDLCFGDDNHCLDWSLLQGVLENPTATTALKQPGQSPLQPVVVKTASTNTSSVASADVPASTGTQPDLPTILSVDDSPIVQKMIQRTLSPVCNVLLANNALLALQVLNRETDIALVLLDVNMPGVSGLDFCRTIRGIPKFKNLPVVMLTANEGHVNKAMGQIAGSTLYLTKPVDDQKLISIVQQYTQSNGGGAADSASGTQASLSAV